jgi:hypothetical protein
VGPVGAAPQLVRVVTLITVAATAAASILNMMWRGTAPPAQIAVAAVTLPMVGALQLYHGVPRDDGAPPRAWKWTLAVQIVAVSTAVSSIGIDVFGFGGLVAGSALVLLPRPWSWGIVMLFVIGAGAISDPLTPGILFHL